MQINFNAPIFASSAEAKTLTGQIVPFGVTGNTSGGPVQFAMGAFDKIEPVKLFLEHDMARPIGKMVDFNVTPTGINATFSVVDTQAGRDTLIEASSGLRDGFSIGADVIDYEMRDNVMVVTASRIVEVSVVTNPAFGKDAKISEVNASENVELQQDETTPTIGENVEIETTQVEVEETAEPVVVEASAPAYTKPRMASPDDLTRAVVLAARGDQRSSSLITAALDGATTVTSPGVVPVTYMPDVISVINSSRDFINSIRRAALPASGTSFKKPRWSSYPTVDVHTEGGAVASNPALIEDITIDIASRMGGNKVAVELIDRSDPSYFAELRTKLAEAYAINTDTAAITAFLDTVTAATGTGWAGLVDAVGKVRTNSKRSANRLLLSVDQWAVAMQLEDGTGRQLFAPIGQQNANGSLTAFSGNILGLQVVVSDNAPSGTAVVYNDAAATYYEAPGSPAVLQATVVSTAEIEVAVKGYDALALDYTFDVGSPAVPTNYAAYSVTLA